MNNYRTSDFNFELPQELIAQYPLPERSASRLLYLNVSLQNIQHRNFKDITQLLKPNDLLIFNNTKVIPARMLGNKESGGKIECLIDRILSNNRALAHIRANKPPRAGSCLIFERNFKSDLKINLKSDLEGVLIARVLARRDDLYEIIFESDTPILDLLYQYGRIPLPHYMQRNPEQIDLTRYQTIYASQEGAVAAPTAGLHFDEDVISKIKENGVEMAYVTLHVGAGTFQPVRVEQLDLHQMHYEYMELSATVCDAITKCRARGGRVIAVGTTVVRSLETAAKETKAKEIKVKEAEAKEAKGGLIKPYYGETETFAKEPVETEETKEGMIKPYHGETNLFIHPGYRFQVVDAMITNFHLPCSTLLMLVTAFGGYEFIMKAYREAVKDKYRFFSYGDAMFIEANTQ